MARRAGRSQSRNSFGQAKNSPRSAASAIELAIREIAPIAPKRRQGALERTHWSMVHKLRIGYQTAAKQTFSVL